MMLRARWLLLVWLFLKVIPNVHAVEVIEGAEYVKPMALIQAIKILENTERGKGLLEQAQHHRVPIRAGAVSKTEITVTRVVEPQSFGKKPGNTAEKLHFAVQVMISQEKEPVFQALDLAHELVHAIHEKKNPFDPNMTATEYVEHGIEGAGGEAHAIAEECKVGHEVARTLNNSTSKLIAARCRTVWKLEKDETTWKKSFYQLGRHYRAFVQEWLATRPQEESVEAWKEKLAARTPLFSSASAHKPYPVALLEEYIEITRTICARALGSPARCRALPPSYQETP